MRVMRLTRSWRTQAGLAAMVIGAALFASDGRPAPRFSVPDIVFVSRAPVPERGVVPGLGPHHRASALGGRLMVLRQTRHGGGFPMPLLPEGAMFDVSDPAVSFDARRIAFAGKVHRDSAWRIHVVSAGGGVPLAVTRASGPGDDLDPCWVADSLLCFASTRQARRSQYADLPTTNLWTIRLDGSRLTRLTAEANGAEEPVFDPRSGRLLYSRWWFNRHRPSAEPPGITERRDAALAMDSVNVWQVVSLGDQAGGVRLAAGDLSSRRGTMGYQPTVLWDGAIVAVYASNLGLSPRPGTIGIQRMGGFGQARRLAGALVPDRAQDPYAEASGLAAPAACAPAALPDGRIVFAYDPGGRGDFGIWCMELDGSDFALVVDLPGTLELDPVALVPRGLDRSFRSATVPDVADATFTFECRSVFATGGLDGPWGPGPPLVPGLLLRFFASAASGGADSAVWVADVPVRADGFVRASGLPARVPMFEQLVTERGRVLVGAAGPAHVAGLNFGMPGGTTRCVGCHVGHSGIPAGGALDAPPLPWVNASPSARASANGALAGTAGPRAVADGRTRGPAREVAWLAPGGEAELALAWSHPLEIREVVLHPPRADRDTRIAVRRCALLLYARGREVRRVEVRALLASGGTRLALRAPVRADSLAIRIARSDGRWAGVPATGLAEVVTVARLAGS